MEPVDWKGVAWLYRQLPEWTRLGLVTPEAAAALQAHYGTPPTSRGSRVLVVVFAILGAALIGGGIILLLAHNWDDLGRPARIVLSLLPLVVAQILGLHARLNRADSPAWIEATALFQSLMIGASIALVSQTYHISGDFRGFMLVWMLLTLPTIFLHRSTLGALVYLGLFLFWAFAEWRRPEVAHYWSLLFPIALFYALRLREAPASWHSAALGYGFLATLTITLPYALRSDDSILLSFYAGLSAVSYLLHRSFVPDSAGVGRKPLYFFGAGGIWLLTLILSYRDMWGSWTSPSSIDPFRIPTLLAYAVIFGLALRVLRYRLNVNWVAVALPLVVIFVDAISWRSHEKTFPALILNTYGLILGVIMIRRGLQSGHLGTTNAGLLLLAALIIARFFDSEFGLLERGVAFVLLGMGFLAVNYVLLRKNRRDT